MVIDVSNPNNNINYDNQNNQKFKIDGIGYKILFREDMQEKHSLVETLFPSKEEKRYYYLDTVKEL
jgi:hypothetical protein